MKLILKNGSTSTEYRLPNPVTVVGSADDVDIHLNSNQVVDYHAAVREQQGKFTIHRLNNKAKIYINGHPVIEGQTLWPRDEIKLGQAEFIFHHDHASASAASSEADAPFPETAANNWQIDPENNISQSQFAQLDALDNETLEALRQKSPKIKPVSGVKAFIQQGWHQANDSQNKRIFGLMMTLPAVALSLYQNVRTKFTQADQAAFEAGTWQFYTEFALREDTARHANETEGFHQAIPSHAKSIDQATAWVYQSIITLFEYEALLENEWIERTLLRLVHQAVSESVVERLIQVEFPDPDDRATQKYQSRKDEIWRNEIERIELETEQIKDALGLSKITASWVKMRPYRKPRSRTDETYPQYRRRCFLKFLAIALKKLPAHLGAIMWDRYYELSATALPAYQAQMSILNSLKPSQQQDVKMMIPLWQAKIGFVLQGRYYFVDAAQKNEAGQLLIFNPAKTDDPGEPLSLTIQEDGDLIDQHGRAIVIDRKGTVTVQEGTDEAQIKAIRPVPIHEIKAILQAIFADAKDRPPSISQVDLLLAQASRPQQPELIQTLTPDIQTELKRFDVTPIIVNWDQQARSQTLQQIRNTHRGIGNHALTIFHTESSFVFDQSHIFYDAIWGMIISEIITDRAIETYHHVAKLEKTSAAPTIDSIQLTGNRSFRLASNPYTVTAEVTAETDVLDLGLVNQTRQHLKQLQISLTVNDLLTFYRTIHDHFYDPGLALQRQLLQFKMDKNKEIVDQIEANWQAKRLNPVSLLLPMDASFVDPSLRLFPTTFRNFLPEFVTIYQDLMILYDKVTYTPSPEAQTRFTETKGRLLANLVVLVEYFNMLKQVTRQGASLSTAAIKYLAHLPPSMQGALDAIPEQIGALNEVLKGEEVFSNVGRVAPSSSLVRFMSAKDDGRSKFMVWGLMCDRTGTLKITLRDFRPHVAQLQALGQTDLATLITQDYVESYARGVNQFAEDLAKVVAA
ncbi:MAG: FHA domain-containing protein [Chloroflexota bacterium]